MQVNIKGRKYKVKYVKSIEDGTAIGRTNRIEKIIEITKCEESTEETIQTIIHELLHAYLDECGFCNESSKEIFNYWLEANYLQMFDSLLKIFPMIYPEYTKKCKTIAVNINRMLKEQK